METLKLHLIEQIIRCEDETLLRAAARLLAPVGEGTSPDVDIAASGVLDTPRPANELESLRREIDEFFGD
jgi:hypothetical protein